MLEALVSTKMRRFRALCDVFPLFMKFGGLPKRGGGVLTPRNPPPPGSAPELSRVVLVFLVFSFSLFQASQYIMFFQPSRS